MTIYKALNQFQFKLTNSVSISNTHLSMYKMMAMLVYLCSILVSTTTMFGDPINCMVQAPVPEKMFTSYCYMESSYSYSRPTNSSHYDFSNLTTKPNYYQKGENWENCLQIQTQSLLGSFLAPIVDGTRAKPLFSSSASFPVLLSPWCRCTSWTSSWEEVW